MSTKDGLKLHAPEASYLPSELAARALLIGFYDALSRRDLDAARAALGDGFTQHSPFIADGPDALIAHYRDLWAAHPDHSLTLKNIWVEEELVVCHVHARNTPNGTKGGDAVAALYRVADGRIVEQWDSTQPVPDTAHNPNSMF